ncbi:MAG TPA: hypothetical protein VIJ59_10345, partial [Caulobacteraceae bacterium]
TLTLLANGKIVQQNTSSGGASSGIVIETPTGTTDALTLGCATCTTSLPTVIDLFGTLGDGAGHTLTGPQVAQSSEIKLVSPLAMNLQYRANGCVIQDAAVCGPILTVPIVPIITELPPTQTIETLLASLDSPPLLDVSEYDGDADVTIIGSGNEEIWRKPDSEK